MLFLAALYFTLQMLACCLLREPPPTSAGSIPTISTTIDAVAEDSSAGTKALGAEDLAEAAADLLDDDRNLTPREALATKEFYILWLTRFSVVLVTQTVAGFYKVRREYSTKLFFLLGLI